MSKIKFEIIKLDIKSQGDFIKITPIFSSQ